MNTDNALAEAIKQVAQAKVAEALGGDILGKMIREVMDHRAKSYGSGKGNPTAFERLVTETIQDMLRKIVRETMEARRDEFVAAVGTAMGDHMHRMASAVIEAFTSDDWRASLTVTVPAIEA